MVLALITGARSQQHRWWLFAVACLVGLSVLYFRRPDAFTNPQFYAEDGRDFFAQAYEQGWRSLFYRVNGYFAVYPRAVDIIALSVGTPLVLMPTVHLFACLVAYLVVWVVVFVHFPGPVMGRLLAVLATVLPPLGNEIWMNTTNVQWPLSLLVLILGIAPPPRMFTTKVFTALALVLAACSGPYALLLFPVLVVHHFIRGERTLRSLPWPALLVGCGAILNAVSLLQHGTVERTDGQFDLFDPGFVQAAFRQFWYPFISKAVHAVPIVWGSVLLVAFLVGWGLLLRRTAQAHRATAITYACASLVLLVATLVSYRGDPGFLSPFYAGIRNFYLPTVFFAWSVIASIRTFDRKRTAILLAFAGYWVFLTFRHVGPLRYADQHWPMYARALEAGTEARVPITPEGWYMDLAKPAP